MASNDWAEDVLGEAAHLRDLPVEKGELVLVGLHDVLVHRVSLGRRAGSARI